MPYRSTAIGRAARRTAPRTALARQREFQRTLEDHLQLAILPRRRLALGSAVQRRRSVPDRRPQRSRTALPRPNARHRWQGAAGPTLQGNRYLRQLLTFGATS